MFEFSVTLEPDKAMCVLAVLIKVDCGVPVVLL